VATTIENCGGGKTSRSRVRGVGVDGAPRGGRRRRKSVTQARREHVMDAHFYYLTYKGAKYYVRTTYYTTSKTGIQMDRRYQLAAMLSFLVLSRLV
jgi:hypothetical protein